MRPAGFALLQFAKNVVGEHFALKISSVQFFSQNGFVQFLQFRHGKPVG